MNPIDSKLSELDAKAEWLWRKLASHWFPRTQANLSREQWHAPKLAREQGICWKKAEMKAFSYVILSNIGVWWCCYLVINSIEY